MSARLPSLYGALLEDRDALAVLERMLRSTDNAMAGKVLLAVLLEFMVRQRRGAGPGPGLGLGLSKSRCWCSRCCWPCYSRAW